MCSWGGGGRQCLVLRGTRVPPSCQWGGWKRGILRGQTGMRIPIWSRRILPSWRRGFLAHIPCFLSLKTLETIISLTIPVGARRIRPSCHHYHQSRMWFDNSNNTNEVRLVWNIHEPTWSLIIHPKCSLKLRVIFCHKTKPTFFSSSISSLTHLDLFGPSQLKAARATQPNSCNSNISLYIWLFHSAFWHSDTPVYYISQLKPTDATQPIH